MLSEKDFTDQIDLHKGIIIKVIRLYVNDVENEKDLFQEIVFQAWKSNVTFRGDSKFSTWLYRLSLNTVLTYKRKPQLFVRHEDLASLDYRSTESGLPDETELLYTAIRQLNEIDRIILTSHLDGYENHEISDITGLTRNNVAVRLHRAKEAVAEKIKLWK